MGVETLSAAVSRTIHTDLLPRHRIKIDGKSLILGSRRVLLNTSVATGYDRHENDSTRVVANSNETEVEEGTVIKLFHSRLSCSSSA